MEPSLELKPKVEALLHAADRPVTLRELAQSLETSEEEVEAALAEYESELLCWDRGIEVRRRPNGVRIVTKAPYTELIWRLFPERRPKPLSSAALEALAFIALKQPVSTADISASREVDSAAAVQTLRERRLIEGGGVGPQREKLWRTTKLFLETFNLASLDDLYKEARFQEVFVHGSAAGEVGDNAADEVDSSGTLDEANPLR